MVPETALPMVLEGAVFLYDLKLCIIMRNGYIENDISY